LQSKLKLFVYQDSLYSGFLNAAKLRAKTGETNKLEMFSARSQSMDIKNQLQQINADLIINNQKLQVLLNSDDNFYPADTVLKPVIYFITTDSLAIVENPTLGYAKQQVEVSRIEKKLENSLALPEFTIGYSNQSMIGSQDVNGAPRIFSGRDRFQTVQAGVSIPLWFAPYTAKSKAAKIKEQTASVNAASYYKSLTGNYRSLLLELSKNKNSLDYYEKQAIPEADMIIEQATQSYKAGEMDYLSYIQSLSSALGIKENYLDALNNYNQTVISIEQITGKIY